MATTLDARNVTVTLDWSPELDAVATRLAEKAGQPKNEWLKRLLLEALEDAEDYADSEDVMARIRSGEERTYTADEVRRALGLDD